MSVTAWEADLFPHIAAALAKDDELAQRRRWASHSAALSRSTNVTKLQDWLAAFADGEQ